MNELWKLTGTYLVVNAEAIFGPWMMVDRMKNKFKGGGAKVSAPKESNKGDVNQKGETSGGSNNVVGGDSDGQWQLVSRNKGKLSVGKLASSQPNFLQMKSVKNVQMTSPSHQGQLPI